MEIGQIAHLKTLFSVTHYVGCTIEGYLLYLFNFISDIKESRTKLNLLSLLNPLKKDLEKINILVNNGFLYSEISEENISATPDAEELFAYIDQLELKDRNLILLLDKLILLYLDLLANNCKLANCEDRSLIKIACEIENILGNIIQDKPDEKSFADYLVAKKYISREKINKAGEIQKTVNQPFGQIAVRQGFMLEEHIDKVLKVQLKIKKPFGELAEQMGILEREHIDMVLQFQQEHYVDIKKILVLEKYLPQHILDQEWHNFKLLKSYKKNGEKYEVLVELPEIWDHFKQNMVYSQLNNFRDFFISPNLLPSGFLLKATWEKEEIYGELWSKILATGFTMIGKEAKNCLKIQTLNQQVFEFITEKAFVTKPALSQNGGKKGKLDVLLVDDDALLCELVENMLATEGYGITTFQDPFLAAKKIPQLNPDVALLDYHMEGMDGLSLLQIIHQSKPNLPVIIITGDLSTQLGGAAVRSGAYDCLDKPFRQSILIKKLEEAYKTKATHSSWSCKGNISVTPVIEVLQICSAARQSGRLLFSYNQEQMAVIFEEGQIINARYHYWQDLKALIRIAGLTDGNFEFTTLTEECPAVITIDSEILLMEMARQCDEIRHLKQLFPSLTTPLIVCKEQDTPDILFSSIQQYQFSIEALLDFLEIPDLSILQSLHQLWNDQYIKFE